MEITEVRVKLMEEPGERLLAFCSITFDHCFVIRDLKIIDGGNGSFVAMPSRKLTVRCPRCRCKNYLKAAFCNQCGLKLEDAAFDLRDEAGRAKLYADIAHPINTACREMIQRFVVQAYEEELERSKQPGYVPSYSDFADPGEEGDDDLGRQMPGPHFKLDSGKLDGGKLESGQFRAGKGNDRESNADGRQNEQKGEKTGKTNGVTDDERRGGNVVAGEKSEGFGAGIFE